MEKDYFANSLVVCNQDSKSNATEDLNESSKVSFKTDGNKKRSNYLTKIKLKSDSVRLTINPNT